MMNTMNPLASTVLMIRKGATTSFQAGFEQLPEDEQFRILNDFEFLSAGKDIIISTEHSSEQG